MGNLVYIVKIPTYTHTPLGGLALGGYMKEVPKSTRIIYTLGCARRADRGGQRGRERQQSERLAGTLSVCTGSVNIGERVNIGCKIPRELKDKNYVDIFGG